MKAILIDVYTDKIDYIDNIHGFKEMQEAIGCRCFTVGHRIEYKGNTYTIFVDDEGLYNQSILFFFKGAHQPFFGRGLILKDLPGGESGNCDIPLAEIHKRTTILYRPDLINYNDVEEERWGLQ